MRKKIKKICMAVVLFMMALSLAGTVNAAEPAGSGDQYIYYEEGLLDDGASRVLNSRAAEVSGAYDSGVYMVMVNDYKAWDADLDLAAQEIYEELGLGLRDDRDGIMLLLSMRERDYILLVHGVFANETYGEYARDVLADAFLEEFGENDFPAGISDYIEECGHMLALSAEGTPLTRESNPQYQLLKWLISVGLGIVVALVIAALIRSRMNNVAVKTQADQYVSEDGVRITLRRDQFTHMTQTRVKIETHSSGSSGGGGGGYSSSSGKF